MSTTKTRKKEIVRTLRQALKMMNNSGAHWTQGTYRNFLENGEAAYCSVGAVQYAVAGLNLGEEVEEEALAALAYRLPGAEDAAHDRIVYWNDTGGRKWEDIVKQFETAIARVEKA